MLTPNKVSMEDEFEKIIDGILTQGYGYSDAFLKPEEVKSFQEAFDGRMETGQFRPAAIGPQSGKQIMADIRGDLICWLPEDGLYPIETTYLNRIEEMIGYFNRTCYLGLQDAELHYAQYPVGAFYKRHLDRFKTDSHRKLSVICYLNQDWQPTDGGQLVLYPAENQIETLQPVGGRLVCFESDKLEHEVLPALRPRRSVTGWLRTR